MRRPSKQTNMVFRVFPEGDVIAIFIDEIADHKNNLMSYQHVGQHGACSPELIDELRPATLEEADDLKAELLSLGYDFKEVDRE